TFGSHSDSPARAVLSSLPRPPHASPRPPRVASDRSGTPRRSDETQSNPLTQIRRAPALVVSLCALCGFCVMSSVRAETTNNYAPVTSQNWSGPLNWGLGFVPDFSNAAMLSNATVNCTVDVAMACASFIVASTYTKTC